MSNQCASCQQLLSDASRLASEKFTLRNEVEQLRQEIERLHKEIRKWQSECAAETRACNRETERADKLVAAHLDVVTRLHEVMKLTMDVQNISGAILRGEAAR